MLNDFVPGTPCRPPPAWATLADGEAMWEQREREPEQCDHCRLDWTSLYADDYAAAVNMVNPKRVS